MSGSVSLSTKAVTTTFLGFSLFYRGELGFFQFTVLPFGLAVGPHLFTKTQRVLVKHWRGEGFLSYLDDGASADQVLKKAMKIFTLVRTDIALSGFIVL